MPTLAGAALVQVVWDHSSALPRDALVNTLCFDVHNAGSSSSWKPLLSSVVGNGIGAAAGSNGGLLGHMAECLAGTYTVKVYDLGQSEPRDAFEEQFPFTVNASTVPLPNEVALCLSFKTSQGNVSPSNRGRIYFGPLNGSSCVAEDAHHNAIPSTGLQSALLNLGTRLYDGAIGNDMEWAVYSRKNNSLGLIQNCWVDNAFDTQRRRGNDPTGRVQTDLTA